MPGYTTNKNIPKPVVGADTDVWGDQYRDGMDIIDELLTNGEMESLTVSSNATNPTPVSETAVHIVGASGGLAAKVSIDGFGNAGWFVGRMANGTAASPTTTTISAYLASFAGRGYLVSGYCADDLARISFQAEETFTGTSARTGILFEVTDAGSLVLSEKMRLNGKGQLLLNTSSATNSSVGFELSSTTRAVLLSRMTTTQRDALTAVNGMIIYNSTLNRFQGYENGTWTNLGAA